MNHNWWDTLYNIHILDTKEIYISVKLTVFIAAILSQNKSYTIITGLRPRDSCRGLFKKLKLLPLQSQNILSLSLFILNNKNIFHVNSEIHGFNTRQNSNLHQPQANLSLYQRGAYYSGILVLPSNIKKLSCDVIRFKLDFGKYLHLKSFYTLEEYFNSTKS